MRIVLLALLLAGCGIRFDVAPGVRASRVVEERRFFYLWAMLPTATVSVRARCPHGVVAIEERATAVDVAITVGTVGLLASRTSVFYCRP